MVTDNDQGKRPEGALAPVAVEPNNGWSRWGLPALAVIAVAGAYAVRTASAGGAHSAVLLVGSRTTAAFLDCQAQIRSDVPGDPALIVVSGGELAGFEVLKDSDVHAPRSGGVVDIVGLSIGPPDLERLRVKVAGGHDTWVALPLFDRYPLGLVVAQDQAAALDSVARPCADVAPGRADITRCLRPRSIRTLLRAEHDARAHGAARQFLMVPDSAGGTWEALDRLIWPKGEDATSEWIEPDARFRIDMSDVTARPHAVAFGLPPTGSGACAPPFGVRELGICDADGDDASPCTPARVSLYAYTRVPSDCVEGKPCKLHDSLCGVLRAIYTRLGDAKAQSWSSTCELRERSGGLLRPF
jgi:hypothetical protein